jgi:hypothetical protein
MRPVAKVSGNSLLLRQQTDADLVADPTISRVGIIIPRKVIARGVMQRPTVPKFVRELAPRTDDGGSCPFIR